MHNIVYNRNVEFFDIRPHGVNEKRTVITTRLFGGMVVKMRVKKGWEIDYNSREYTLLLMLIALDYMKTS